MATYQDQLRWQAEQDAQRADQTARDQAGYQSRIASKRAGYAAQNVRPGLVNKPSMYGKSRQQMRDYFTKNFSNRETTVQQKLDSWLKDKGRYDASVAKQTVYDDTLARMEAANYGEKLDANPFAPDTRLSTIGSETGKLREGMFTEQDGEAENRYSTPYLRNWGQDVLGYKLGGGSDISGVLKDFANRYSQKRELPTTTRAGRDFFGGGLLDMMKRRKAQAGGGTIDRNLDTLFGGNPGFKGYINDQLGIDYGDNDFDALYNSLNKNYGALGTV